MTTASDILNAIDPSTKLSKQQMHTASDILLNGLKIGQRPDEVKALLRQQVLDTETVDRLNKTIGLVLDAETYASCLMITFCQALDTYLALTRQAEAEPKPRYYC